MVVAIGAEALVRMGLLRRWETMSPSDAPTINEATRHDDFGGSPMSRDRLRPEIEHR